VPRRQAVSGHSQTGPKAARYLAPAGSVYFFEVVGDEPVTVQEMEQLWLTSVCESPNDRGDGFGLAVPGVWRYAEGEEELCKQDPCSFTR
jgi:CRISPR-associated protein Cmr3